MKQTLAQVFTAVFILSATFFVASGKTIEYADDETDFPNPERGLYVQNSIWDQEQLDKARTDHNATVIRIGRKNNKNLV